MTFVYCPTWYLFYGFPTVFPFDGLVLWVRAGAISGQQLQCDICIDDIFAIVIFAYCSMSYLFYGFPTVFPFDGLVLWVRAGAISGQQVQCDICIDDIFFLQL